MNRRHESAPVVVAGGGIAGLTLALTLAETAIPVVVLEARAAHAETGAGIQLGPNATRILAALGVGDVLAPTAVCPQAIHVADARSGTVIARLPLGAWMEQRHGAAYWVVHRADLHAALLSRVSETPGISLRNGFEAAEVASGADATVVRAASGEEIEARLVVGADGLWSRLRQLVCPGFNLTYAGTTAARAVVGLQKVPAALREPLTHVWLAANAHIVAYPVAGGSKLAIVVITQGPQPDAGWGIPVDAKAFLPRFAPVNAQLDQLLAAAEDWRSWALFDPKPLPRWSDGRTVLIGDAAHPILPYLAQGGAMAIEDAYVLGRLVGQHPFDPAIVCEAFEAQRRDRVGQIQRASRENGRIYHLSGVAAAARNMAMRAAPAQRLMQRYDWIYAWRYDPDYGEVEL